MEKEDMMWVTCPVCHNKTRVKLRRDTVIYHFLLFCPKCRQENLVNARDFHIEVIES